MKRACHIHRLAVKNLVNTEPRICLNLFCPDLCPHVPSLIFLKNGSNVSHWSSYRMMQIVSEHYSACQCQGFTLSTCTGVRQYLWYFIPSIPCLPCKTYKRWPVCSISLVTGGQWQAPLLGPEVVLAQCISIRSNGMLDAFMQRYNHYCQSVIRSQPLCLNLSVKCCISCPHQN